MKRLLAPSYSAATLLLWTLYLLATYPIYVITSWLPTLMHRYGWSMDHSVNGIMAFGLGGILGGFLLGWLVDRGFTRLCLLLGFVVTGLALAALNVAPAHIAIWLLLIFLTGCSMNGLLYAVVAVTTRVYPTSVRASGLGTASAVGRLGATLAPVIGGWLLAQGASVLQVFSSLIGPMVIGAILVLLFSKNLDVRAS